MFNQLSSILISVLRIEYIDEDEFDDLVEDKKNIIFWVDWTEEINKFGSC